ncbi:MAG: 16S rRNA (cytosine(1402)-N(4))-methyltransferase, partial [Flavobacteriales bacterium]|nr:16S rRNA (cytosine(1402)-N(4))-methyltransferase [Flavobacteriales bacterium]
NSKIQTTDDLKNILSRFAQKGKEQKFFAQVFQALRIEVNDELSALRALLEQSGELIKKGGRLSAISYHSLEDRLVKNFIAKGKFEGELEKDFYGNPQRIFKAVNRKPISASESELGANSRSRSAKLRIGEKI